MVRIAGQDLLSTAGANVARRRSLESAMKETGTRTKVVLRHLPPSLSAATFHDQIAAKYAGAYSWCSFHPGKTSHKHQVPSRAYINFKKPEDVIDFYEDFNGHVFVNERGAQYKATVEYAPYQRIPKPRSKKDVREGTIAKDPEYLAFLEQLDKPTEYLPSAEIQLERREAEKAASLASGGAKDTVIVTPLMEFVRLRRAAKSAPQRGMSASSKLARSAGTTTAYSLSQKRTSEKGRSGPTLYVADSTPATKDLNHAVGPRREEQQRKEREILIERKRKETIEGKEKKLVREAVAAALSSTRANTSSPRAESNKERTVLLTKDSATELPSELTLVQILTPDGDQSGLRAVTPGKSSPAVALLGDGVAPGDAREGNKREVKKKQLLLAKEKDSAAEVGSGNLSSNSNSNGGTSNQRHKSSASGKVPSGVVQQQQSAPVYRAASPVETAPTSKQSHRRDSGGRASPRGVVAQNQPQSASSAAASVDPLTQAQSQPTQVERGGKRPPRPQAIRLAGKDQAVPLMNSSEAETGLAHGDEKSVKQVSSDIGSATSLSERQDSRRLRNKDRPDRPVWTPRRREGVPVGAESPVSSNGTVHPVGVSTVEVASANAPAGTDSTSKYDKGERGNHGKHTGRSGSESRIDSHQGSGTGSVTNSGNAPFGKTRYVEAGNRNSRGGHAAAARDLHADSQLDMKNEIDGKGQGGKQTRENGDVFQNQVSPQLLTTEDRKKLESPLWNEPGGGHRQGGRRERNGPQVLKESDGGITGAELANKITKRGRGPLALGSNEKQVWVAVQKTVTGS